jgi:hypothetical protein
MLRRFHNVLGSRGVLTASATARVAARRISTEQATSRPLSMLPSSKGLYDPANEKDSCGVGLVVQVNKETMKYCFEIEMNSTII